MFPVHDQHDSLVAMVVREFRSSGGYRQVFSHVEYHARGLDGELDVLGVIDRRKRVYAEIKSHDNVYARKKAKEQFERCKRAMPRYDWTFLYVTPEARREYKL